MSKLEKLGVLDARKLSLSGDVMPSGPAADQIGSMNF